MGYPDKLLSNGESIVYEMKPHWRTLVFPAFWLLVIVGLASFLLAKCGDWFSGTTLSVARWAVIVGAVILLIGLVIRPFVYWISTQYVLTTDRIIVRTGIIARSGRDMPLSRVNDVSFEHTVVERFLNCGTLRIESAGTMGQLIIANVPNVEEIQREIYRLHDEDDMRRRREAYENGAAPPPVSGPATAPTTVETPEPPTP